MPATYAFEVHVEDRSGRALESDLVIDGVRFRTDDQGVYRGNATHPVLVLVEHPDHLTEPVPVGPYLDGPDPNKPDPDGEAQAPRTIVRTVKLWAKNGGKVWAMHSGGDVMFGRRYETPTRGEALIPSSDPGKGARNVVSDLSTAFAVADLSTVNLETVLTHLELTQAYPKKRFILRSRPETAEGLLALGVDGVIMANNHSRDFLDIGIAHTVEALARVNLPHTGTAVAESRPDEPLILDIHGIKVGILAWTTVEGSVVNDSYPPDRIPMPSDLEPTESWLYEKRMWGESGMTISGQAWTIESKERRVGEAWDEIQFVEPRLTPTEQGRLWRSATAVYPELQDWVWRREHGGAHIWDKDAPEKIRELKRRVDVVVTQLHAGFQFQESPSGNVKAITHEMVDAGASIVICHHPHVVQGIEWYKHVPIAYSMGNFVFDQDFLSTFPSFFLRTIWEEDRLLEARAVPVELEDYIPRLSTGRMAEKTILTLWERSKLPFESRRDDDDAIRAYPSTSVPDSVSATFVMEGDTALVIEATDEARDTVMQTLSPGAVVASGCKTLSGFPLQVSENSIEVGRDLFGYGRFHDELVHPSVPGWKGGAHWDLNTCNQYERIDVEGQHGYLILERSKKSKQNVHVRPIARVPFQRHRVYGGDRVPWDPTPRYTMNVHAKKTNVGRASIRLDLYFFDDTNPSEDPDSTLLGSKEILIDIPADNAWHSFEGDMPDDVFVGTTPSGENLTANMALINVSYEGEGQDTELLIDDIRLMEWRDPARMPNMFVHTPWVRNRTDAELSVNIECLR